MDRQPFPKRSGEFNRRVAESPGKQSRFRPQGNLDLVADENHVVGWIKRIGTTVFVTGECPFKWKYRLAGVTVLTIHSGLVKDAVGCATMVSPGDEAFAPLPGLTAALNRDFGLVIDVFDGQVGFRSSFI